jgi:hypothetical protein
MNMEESDKKDIKPKPGEDKTKDRGKKSDSSYIEWQKAPKSPSKPIPKPSTDQTKETEEKKSD